MLSAQDFMLTCGSMCFTFGHMLKTCINYTITFKSIFLGLMANTVINGCSIHHQWEERHLLDLGVPL